MNLPSEMLDVFNNEGTPESTTSDKKGKNSNEEELKSLDVSSHVNVSPFQDEEISEISLFYSSERAFYEWLDNGVH